MQHTRLGRLSLWTIGIAAAVFSAGLLQGQTATMANLAETLLAKLEGEQREDVRFEFDGGERRDWTYFPWGHHGVALKDMSPAARTATRAFVESALSEAGTETMDGILTLEEVLHRDAWIKLMRDPGRYYVALFGEPGEHPWGWRFEGHHLSINVTATARGVSGTPFFTGANPATVRDGPNRGLRVLGQEEDDARALFRSLNPSQRKAALIDEEAPSDILTGRDEKAEIECCEGIAAGELNAQQRQKLRQLMERIIDKLHPEIAATHWEGVENAGFDTLHFAWAGSDQAGEGHYYRIHGPTLLIEYDNTQNDANHAHLVLRDLRHDFGGDLLAEHYREEHR